MCSSRLMNSRVRVVRFVRFGRRFVFCVGIAGILGFIVWGFYVRGGRERSPIKRHNDRRLCGGFANSENIA